MSSSMMKIFAEKKNENQNQLFSWSTTAKLHSLFGSMKRRIESGRMFGNQRIEI